MHIGQIDQTIPLWATRWIDSAFGRGGHIQEYKAGTTTRKLERYQCENCGSIHDVLGLATEPFFCDCHRLIQIHHGTMNPPDLSPTD